MVVWAGWAGWVGWAAVVGLPGAVASAQFYSVGHAAGSTESSGVALSSDGMVAVGYSTPSLIGYTWTRSGGRVDFGSAAGMPVARSGGISGDGRVIVGTSYTQGGSQIAFRWSGPGTFQTLGTVSSFYSRTHAVDASADGGVIVGYANDRFEGMSVPFRWTAGGGMQSLGAFPGAALTEATAVSDDGRVICGTSVGQRSYGWTWTEEGGYEVLPVLDGTDGQSFAYGMNRLGSAVVGTAGFEAYSAMWRGGEVIRLGDVAGRPFTPYAVDDLGTVAVGITDGGASHWATVWTQARGAELLSDYLAANGVEIPTGVSLLSCTAVSADGRTFTGTAVSHDGPATAFGYVVTIPAPGVLVVAAWGLLSAGARRRGKGQTGRAVDHRAGRNGPPAFRRGARSGNRWSEDQQPASKAATKSS